MLFRRRTLHRTQRRCRNHLSTNVVEPIFLGLIIVTVFRFFNVFGIDHSSVHLDRAVVYLDQMLVHLDGAAVRPPGRFSLLVVFRRIGGEFALAIGLSFSPLALTACTILAIAAFLRSAN